MTATSLPLPLSLNSAGCPVCSGPAFEKNFTAL